MFVGNPRPSDCMVFVYATLVLGGLGSFSFPSLPVSTFLYVLGFGRLGGQFFILPRQRYFMLEESCSVLHFPEQENCLQTFKLPEPVLCIGGYLQIELLEIRDVMI